MYVGPSPFQAEPESNPADLTPITGEGRPGRRSDAQAQPPPEFQVAQAHVEVGTPQPRRSSASAEGTSTTAPLPPEMRQQMEAQYLLEARRREQQYPINVTAKDSSAHAPVHRTVRPKHVRQVLSDMFAGDAARFMPSEISGSPLYLELPQTGITLTPTGRELLADYYTRKYGASIRFHQKPAQMEDDVVQRLFEVERKVEGEHVRAAHYFGHGDLHATLIIYVREGDKEALMWFDSSQRVDLRFGMRLAEDCAALAPDGKSIPVYQHVWSLQHAGMGCTVFAMKAAATLTSRSRNDETREFESFTRPNLLDALDARQIEGPAPPGVVPIWALPELARMGQTLSTISAHAGPDLDVLLPGSKLETLRELLERHTYESHFAEAPNYVRDKGEQFAEIVDIEMANLLIGRRVRAENWGPELQDDFVNRMRNLVSLPLTIEDGIEDMEIRLRTFNRFMSNAELEGQFAKAAAFVFGHIQAERIDIPERSLIKQLSAGRLHEFDQYLDTTIARWTRFNAVLQLGWKAYGRKDGTVHFRDGAEDELSVMRKAKSQVRDELDYRMAVQRPPETTSVVDLIEAVPQTSIGSFVSAARVALEAIERSKISLRDKSGTEEALNALETHQLTRFTEELRSHKLLLDSLADRCNRIAAVLAPNLYSDDDDVESTAPVSALADRLLAALNMAEAELGMLEEVVDARS